MFRVEANRGRGVRNDLVEHDDVIDVREDRAQQRSDGLATRARDADGPDIGRNAFENRCDESPGRIDGVAPRLIVDIEERLARLYRRQDRLGARRAQIEAQGRGPAGCALLGRPLGHDRHLVAPTAGGFQNGESLPSRPDELLRISGQRTRRRATDVPGRDDSRPDRLEAHGICRRTNLLAQQFFERLHKRPDPRGAANEVDGTFDPIARQQRLGVAGNRREVAIEQLAGGFALVGEMRHLGLGENRTAGRDRDAVRRGQRDFVGVLDAQAETAGDLLDVLTRT